MKAEPRLGDEDDEAPSLSQTWQFYILPQLHNTGKKFEPSDTVVRALLSHNWAIKFVLFIN